MAIRRNGRLWKDDCPAAPMKHQTLRASRCHGRAFWQRRTGGHARRRIEAPMRRLKAFGERITPRDPDRHAVELHTRLAPMSRFSALGQAEIPRGA